MANTLTNLFPDMYAALDAVSRELVGFIPAVSRDSSYEMAALNQTVRSFVAGASTPVSISPGVTPPDTGDQTINNVTISISNAYAVPFRFNGEEQKGLNTGPGYENVKVNVMAQAMRGIVNQIEAGIAGLYVNASNAAIPAGTTFFDAANYKDLSAASKLLSINGAPLNDRHLILSNTAAAQFRGNAQNTAWINAGDVSLLKQGLLGQQFGIDIRESGQVKSVAIGTGATVSTDTTGYAVGATSITLKAAGTGTIKAGDSVLITGDPNRYVVTTLIAAVSGATMVLAAPGLKVAVPASETVVTVQSGAEKNLAFSRNAIHLVTRLPAIPQEGDLAIDRAVITDPRSGLSFAVAVYPEYHRVHYEISAAWGFACIKPEHLVILQQ